MVRETRMNAPAVIGLRLVVRNEGRAKRRDFYDRYDLLLANWYLLTNRIQQEIEEVRHDLHQELACWQPHQPEPDWNAYAERVNVICRAGGFQLSLSRRIS
jgi:hypothetical protein